SFDTIMDNLIEMKGLATQAANDSLGGTEREYIGEQIKALGNDINDIANQTVFQDFPLLSGGNGGQTDGLSLTFQVGERASDTITVDLAAVNINQLFSGSNAAVDGTTSFATKITHADDFGLEPGQTITGGYSTRGTGGDAIIVEFSGLSVEHEITSDDLFDMTVTINEEFINPEIGGWVTGEPGDWGIEWFNGLDSPASITFTGDNYPGYTVHIDPATTGGGSVKQGGELDFTGWDAEGYRSFITDIDSAIDGMSERVNDIGIAQSSLSVREVTLSQGISANQSAVSRIMDTDFAKEQSESVRLQILQQTATSALAQANMGPQSVLGFLG
ncbi:flagellin, partial [Balneolales bacterium ANBcel1]|nr:flagellin [Balneolales bacterium ANBcel1]